MKLSDVVGIITGAAGGFGRLFAEKILGEGGRVVITDINPENLEKAGKELAKEFGSQISWTVQDVSDNQSFHAVFEFAHKQFGEHANVLVNNAGIGGAREFTKDGCDPGWIKLMQVDLIAVMRGTQVALNVMRDTLGGAPGVVVNIASGAGLFTLENSPEYTAAKYGVVGLTRACEPQKKQRNIRVVAVCPMFANTFMGRLALTYFPEEVEKYGGLVELDEVVNGFTMAVEDDQNAGKCVYVARTGSTYFEFPSPAPIVSEP